MVRRQERRAEVCGLPPFARKKRRMGHPAFVTDQRVGHPPALAGGLVEVSNLLESRIEIASYNHHARLLSSRALGRLAATSLLRSGEPTLSCNQVSKSRPGAPDLLTPQVWATRRWKQGLLIMCGRLRNWWS